MELPRKFLVNGQLAAANNPDPKSNLDYLVETLGPEKAQVYIKAIRDMNEQLKNILWYIKDDEYLQTMGHYKVRSDVKKLFDHNQEFLDICDSLLPQSPAENSPEPK